MPLKPKSINEYFVFVAAPSDVALERQAVREFFNDYNKTVARHINAQFTVIDYSNYASIGVGRPQKLITKQTLDRYKDHLALVIGVMGQRFGSPTGKFDSGTEEEFVWAMKEHRKTGWPEIKWFFKRIDQLTLPSEPKEARKALKQWEKVRAFRAKVQAEGPNQVFSKDFDDGNFIDVFGFDLRLWMNDPDRPWLQTTTPPSADLPPVHIRSPLVSAEVFFKPFLDGSRLFNHNRSLVGRRGQLEALHAFASSASARVAIISGRSGIGKSKLLHAFAEQFGRTHSDKVLSFLSEQARLGDLDETHVALNHVIVIDDAHRYQSLDRFAALREKLPSLKIVLVTRSFYVEPVRAMIARAQFESNEIAQVDPLQELSQAEVIELAVEVLGNRRRRLAEEIAQVTRDSPLITVVGARLIADKAVLPALLNHHADFRYTVLSRFEDELLGDIGGRVKPEISRPLLRMFAATEPFTPDQNFVTAAAKFLQSPESSVVESLGLFETVGLLLRRGSKLRITPDVLSEYVLREACVNSRGEPTGYAERVYEAFKDVCRSQVIRNLSELDWRERQQAGATK